MKTLAAACLVSAAHHGIRWYDNGGSGGMVATENDITVSSSVGVGIELEELNNGTTCEYDITFNEVDVTTQAGGGIITLNVMDSRFWNNNSTKM